VILGKYNHKNENPAGEKCLGMYWRDEDGGTGFPNARGQLATIVLNEHFNEGFLQFIFFQAVKEKNYVVIEKMKKAMEKLL
jgi:hypothetical protein